MKIKNIDLDTVIIGAGFAGIGMAIKLKENGHNSFLLLERSNEIGGTWRDNNYPGCACDIPSFLYSFSFELNPDWSNLCAPHIEILNYLKHCVKKYKLEDHLRKNKCVESVKFNSKIGKWEIKDSNGEVIIARMLLTAVGGLNEPLMPKIKGINKFKGESFHSSNWNHNYELKNKKIAVIGTGASSIQIIPHIVEELKKMTIFQRTAPWISPRMNTEITEKGKEKFKKYPFYNWLWREYIYWVLEIRGMFKYKNSIISKALKKESFNFLKNSVNDPELLKKLTPNYEIGCKRILFSNLYYKAIQKDNVNFVTNNIIEIVENGIIDSTGTFHELDAIVYGTGFKTAQFTHMFELEGLSKKKLFEEWNLNGGEAYYGMAANDMPNFLFLVGPNTGLSHTSIIHVMESQYNYALDYLNKLKMKPDTFLNLKKSVFEKFNLNIQKRLAKLIWFTGGCESWYISGKNKKNVTIWPGSTLSYRLKTKKIKLSDYEVQNTI
jgi:cation diffusion facilitator CzcD-associated flavoprotein CzcO